MAGGISNFVEAVFLGRSVTGLGFCEGDSSSFALGVFYQFCLKIPYGVPIHLLVKAISEIEVVFGLELEMGRGYEDVANAAAARFQRRLAVASGSPGTRRSNFAGKAVPSDAAIDPILPSRAFTQTDPGPFRAPSGSTSQVASARPGQ